MATDPRETQPLTPRALYRSVVLAFLLLAVVLAFEQIIGLVLLVLLVAIIAVPIATATSSLERLRVPRPLGAALTLIAGLAVLGGIIALLVPSFVQEGNHLVSALPRITESLRHELSTVTHAPPGRVGNKLQDFVNGYTGHPEKILGPLTSIGAGVAGALAVLVVVLLTALYAAIRPGPLVTGALRLVPPLRRPDAARLLRRLGEAYLGWLRGLGVGMLVLGLVTYAGLRLVNMPFAVVFAALTALAMVVPYLGALVSSVPPVLLALTISPTKALLVAVIYLVAHQIEGNVIEPIVMARAVKLHPALVAIGVVAVERLFGVLGLMVAVPVLATVKIAVEELWVHPMEQTNAERLLEELGPLQEPEPEPGRGVGAQSAS